MSSFVCCSRIERAARRAMLAGFILAGAAVIASAETNPAPPTDRCHSLQNPAARLRCYDAAAPNAKQQEATSAAWRLVRTPDPRGGPDVVSVTRVAEFSRSDPDFAGLMLRCHGADLEALVVTLRAFPPRARPRVTINAGATSTQFEASVAMPGSALLLPHSASALIQGPWQALTELSVEIEQATTPIRGMLATSGLRSAIETLRANCPVP